MLHAGKVLVRRLEHVAPGHAPALRYRFQIHRVRPAHHLDALGGSRIAHDHLLDLADAAAIELEPERHQRRHTAFRCAIVFGNRRQQRDLLGGHVGHEQAIAALGLHAAPEPVADLEPNAVLGETHIASHRHR